MTRSRVVHVWSALLAVMAGIACAAIGPIGSTAASAAPATDSCGYPTGAGRSATVFNESTIARSIEVLGSGATAQIAVFANDEAGALLGVSDAGSPSTTAFRTLDDTSLAAPLAAGTHYTTLSVAPLPVAFAAGDAIAVENDPNDLNAVLSAPAPAGATTLQIQDVVASQAYGAGTTVADLAVDKTMLYGHVQDPSLGDLAKTDPAGRPYYPVLYVSDQGTAPGGNGSTAGDWQNGSSHPSTTIDDVFGTWATGAFDAAGTYSSNMPDPVNNWDLGPGSDAPAGGFGALGTEGYGGEFRWNISNLRDNNGQPLVPGHVYRFQVIIHDGDQTRTGGDAGELCTNALAIPASVGGTTPASPDLSITKTPDEATVTVGQPVGFTITVSNPAGPNVGTANQVVLDDALPQPPGITWSLDGAPPGACTLSTGAPQTLHCLLGDLTAGTNVAVHVISTATTAPGTVTNTADATPANGPPVSATATVIVDQPPGILSTASSGGTAPPITSAGIAVAATPPPDTPGGAPTVLTPLATPPAAAPEPAILAATSVHTGEPWAGSGPFAAAVGSLGMVLMALGIRLRRRPHRSAG